MLQLPYARKASTVDYALSSYDDDDHSMTETGDYSLHGKYSHTSMLILDYKQFKAARRIQAFWRGHHARMVLDLRWRSAVIIQRWWRGFSARHNFKSFVEEKLQRTLVEHYNESATKIQALFRGWYTRQTVHDMYSLKRMQRCAAEELLSCVAHKLHYLLRTYSIPGVYSLRNSHCLSKVEKLLTSVTYRFHNDRVTYKHARDTASNAMRREQFQRNAHWTEVPYPGPNFNSACKPACEDMLVSFKDMDRRMFKLIAEFENSKIDPILERTYRSLVDRKFRLHVEKVLQRRDKTQRGFCGDIIESMRKWNIWDNKTLTISNDVFRNPENLSQFLDDVAKLIERKNASTCYCRITDVENLQCS